MIKKLLILLMIAFTLPWATSPTIAREKLTVAVADFEPRNVSQMDAASISDFVRVELVKLDLFDMLERKNMRMILAEQKFEMSGCTTRECVIEMGKILNVQRIIFGRLIKLAEVYHITGNVVDVETGKILFAERAECKATENLPDAAEELARTLAAKITGKKPQEIVKIKPKISTGIEQARIQRLIKNKNPWELVKIGKPAIPALVELLKDEDSEVRKWAAVALGTIRDNKSAVPALIETLKDEDSRVRAAAASALANIGDESPVPALTQTLQDEDANVRVSAALSLAQLGNKSGLPVALESRKHKDSEVRQAAAAALGWIGDKSAVVPLTETLKDEEALVRVTAACSLARLGNKSGLPVAVELLAGPAETLMGKNLAVQTLAAITLEMIRDTSLVVCNINLSVYVLSGSPV